MPYEAPQEWELRDEGLTLVQMRMPTVHYWRAERMLKFMTQ